MGLSCKPHPKYYIISRPVSAGPERTLMARKFDFFVTPLFIGSPSPLECNMAARFSQACGVSKMLRPSVMIASHP